MKNGTFGGSASVLLLAGCIYWSFVRFEQDTAVLNGCGELYRHARPAAGGGTIDEWIAFEKY